MDTWLHITNKIDGQIIPKKNKTITYLCKVCVAGLQIFYIFTKIGKLLNFWCKNWGDFTINLRFHFIFLLQITNHMKLLNLTVTIVYECRNVVYCDTITSQHQAGCHFYFSSYLMTKPEKVLRRLRAWNRLKDLRAWNIFIRIYC